MTATYTTLGERLRATRKHLEDVRRKREEAALAADRNVVEDYFGAVRNTWSEDILDDKVPEAAIIPQHVIDILDPDNYGARINDIAHPGHAFNTQWQSLMDWATGEGLSVRLEFTPNNSDSCDLALFVDAADAGDDAAA